LKIYTGYFAQIKKYPHPISIARFKPKWCNDIPEYLGLAPSEKLLKQYKILLEERPNEISLAQNMYEVEFQCQLDQLGFYKILNWLENLANRDPEITLICYERPGNFCHRHLVAEYLAKHCADCIGEYIL